MTERELQRRVTAGIWSQTVREEIERRGIVYAPQELLAIAAAGKDFAHRQALYAQLAEHLPAIAGMARRQSGQEQTRLDGFCRAQPGDVYLLDAVDDPDREAPEPVLCGSWADALALAEAYRAHYWPRGGRVAFRVTKRRILTAADALPGDSAWCCLDDGLRVQSLHWWLPEKVEAGGFPGDCLAETAPRYPLCIPAWSYVKYRWQGWEQYGLLWLTGAEEAMEPDAAIIPLDAAHMADRDEEGRWGHVHVSLADVEPVSVDALPPSLRDAAQEFRAWLMAQMEQ